MLKYNTSQSHISSYFNSSKINPFECITCVLMYKHLLCHCNIVSFLLRFISFIDSIILLIINQAVD